MPDSPQVDQQDGQQDDRQVDRQDVRRAQRVVLHVGLPKTGTTWLQALLAGHRERLAAGGVLYPDLGPGCHFRGAVDVRGSRATFGLAADRVDGAWAALCAAARDHGGTTVLGHEVLAGATPEQVTAALAPLAGLEVHVVVTARDLGRQATAHWQEEVKRGATWSFADLERDQLRADTGRDPAGRGPDDGGARPHFWHAQDAADALRRWSGTIPAERVHLVVCPPPGAPAGLLWERFAEAGGIDPGLVDPAAVPPANPSLGGPEVALLRAVNAAVGDRLDPATRLRVVKRGYAEGVLAAEGAARGSARPLAPAALRDVLAPATRRWVGEIRAAGHPLHGDLADLEPVLGGPGDPPPDVDPPPGADPAAIADRLVREAGGPAAGSAESPAGPRAVVRGLARRLRDRSARPRAE